MTLRNMELCLLMRELWKKDELTFRHSYRVTEIMLSFLNYSGIENKRQKELEIGALLHDIGKIKVDEVILRKKGKLLEQEFLEIRKHPELGAKILREYMLGDTIEKMALYHHERWDGKGYPHRLKEEEIPLEARILSLADSLEAMTGIRPYRSSLSWEEAYEEIRRGRGTQFDPILTEMFLEWMEYYEVPTEQNSEQALGSIINQ
jgi:putative nucleotidyltransferase with HDIG domain